MTTIQIANSILLSEVSRQLQQGKDVKLRVKGMSMTPFIRHQRDSVILSPLTGLPSRGDIILAEITPGFYVLHRVLKATMQQIILMGDGNLKGVEKCAPEHVCGIVTTILRDDLKSINPQLNKWKMCASLWRIALPVRRILLAIYRKTEEYL